MCEAKSLESAFLDIAVLLSFECFMLSFQRAWIQFKIITVFMLGLVIGQKTNILGSRYSFSVSVVESVKTMLCIKSFPSTAHFLVGDCLYLPKLIWSNKHEMQQGKQWGMLKISYLCLCSKSMIKLICEPRSSEL